MSENRMYERREFYGYRQQDVADYLGIQRNVYRRYECGEREIPVHLAVRLADFYKVSLDYLFCRTDNPLINHFTKRKKYYILITGKEQRFFREAQQDSTSFPSGGR